MDTASRRRLSVNRPYGVNEYSLACCFLCGVSTYVFSICVISLRRILFAILSVAPMFLFIRHCYLVAPF
jgi:hypothetical protein